jgi:hypothetical protein
MVSPGKTRQERLKTQQTLPFHQFNEFALNEIAEAVESIHIR